MWIDLVLEAVEVFLWNLPLPQYKGSEGNFVYDGNRIKIKCLLNASLWTFFLEKKHVHESFLMLHCCKHQYLEVEAEILASNVSRHLIHKTETICRPPEENKKMFLNMFLTPFFTHWRGLSLTILCSFHRVTWSLAKMLLTSNSLKCLLTTGG